MKNKLITIGIILLFLVGLALVFINPIEDFLLKRSAKQLDISNYSTEQLQQNNDKEVADADFEFEEVQSLSIQDVLRAQASTENYPVIGSMYVPSVEMQLPILKGVSNDALAVGAGTMKPDQKLGEGNYSLAAHYIEGRDVLFGPLYRAKVGDAIFVTDGSQIYEYKINNKNVILSTDTHVINDQADKKMLTLITCANSGVDRLAVEAEFVDSKPFDKANTNWGQ